LRNKTSATFEIVNVMSDVGVATPSEHRYPNHRGAYIGHTFPLGSYPNIAAGGESRIDLSVELDQRATEGIEELRRHGDIFITVTCVLVAVEREAGDYMVKRIASDWVADEQISSNMFCAYEVPKSRWVQLLKEMGYGDYYLAQIPMPRIRQSRAFKRPLLHLQHAWECFQDGKDRETLAACHDALELLSKELGYEKPDQNAYAVMLQVEGEAEKVAKLRMAFDSCTKFLHLGRHEHECPVRLEHKDAELALLLTHACLGYLSKSDLVPRGRNTKSASSPTKKNTS
jgi:hypothetical protein